jgi:hypothetical protein
VNNEQITELLKQITRIADVLELMQDSDLGSLSGIEVCLNRLAEGIEKLGDES